MSSGAERNRRDPLGMSGKRRENTFRIDFAGVPKKPSYDELHRFVGQTLGMKREEVLRIQCSRFHGCAFIKACDLNTAQRVVEEHDGKHTMAVDKKSYTIRMWMEDGGVDVKLYDLSEDVTDDSIVDFMRDYGDIISIRELAWDSKYEFPDIPTGFRVVRMVVKRNIPSFVVVDGEHTCVSYHGQKQTCRHCGEFAHSGIPCVQNKKLIAQKFDADRKAPSYANVAGLQPASKGTAPTQKQAKPKPSSARPTSASSSNAPVTHTDQTSGSERQKEGSTQAPLVYEFVKPKPIQQSGNLATMYSNGNDKDNSRTNDGNDSDESSSSNSSRSTRRKKMRKDGKGREDTSTDTPTKQ